MKKIKMKRPKLNLDDFEPSQCISIKRTVGSGGMSVIYSTNGKRVTFSKDVLKLLSHPDTIQLGYVDGILAISKFIKNENTSYKLNKTGNAGVIYNTFLVKEIVDRYGLDYSARTSLSFSILETGESNGNPVVYIDMGLDRNMIDEEIEETVRTEEIEGVEEKGETKEKEEAGEDGEVEGMEKAEKTEEPTNDSKGEL